MLVALRTPPRSIHESIELSTTGFAPLASKTAAL
jgi:hypothetical protein